MPTNIDAHGQGGEVDYPATYQREISPTWLNFAAALCGAALRDLRSSFRYLELGCGRSYSVLVHAASHPQGEFYACDADAAAIAGARKWAADLDIKNLSFLAASFSDPALRDLPCFDFIALHGIYSWVDASARVSSAISCATCWRRAALAYVSYNCLPDGNDEAPLRRLLSAMSRSSANGDRIAAAVRDVQPPSDVRLGVSENASGRRARRGQMAEQPARYLAQEYLAPAWEPLWSVDVIDRATRAAPRVDRKSDRRRRVRNRSRRREQRAERHRERLCA